MPKRGTKKRGLGWSKVAHEAATHTAVDNIKTALADVKAAVAEGNCGRAYVRMGEVTYQHGQYEAHRRAARDKAARWPAELYATVEPAYAKKCIVGYGTRPPLAGAHRRKRRG